MYSLDRKSAYNFLLLMKIFSFDSEEQKDTLGSGALMSWKTMHFSLHRVLSGSCVTNKVPFILRKVLLWVRTDLIILHRIESVRDFLEV